MKTRKAGSMPSPAIITVIIVGLTIGVVFLISAFREGIAPAPAPARQIEVKSSDRALESSVMGIASEFLCSCGNCIDQKLDQCPCETAQGARQMIRASLQSGQTASQVFAAVDSAYGGRILKVN